jgi:hypothetical protein
MAIDFCPLRFTYPSTTGRRQEVTLACPFPTTVNRACAAINGFSIGFSSSDHHLFRVEADITRVSWSFGTVSVTVGFALRDSSGFFDDPYDGFIDVLVIVDRQ